MKPDNPKVLHAAPHCWKHSGKIEWWAPGASSATRTTTFSGVSGNTSDSFAPAVCGTWTLKIYFPATTFQDDDTFSITACGNTAPTLANPGDKTVNEGSLLTFTLSATDPDSGQTISYSISGGSQSGMSLNSSTGAFSWTPTEAQGQGSYPFTFRVTDNGTPVLYDEESITITVNEVNVAPVLAAIGAQTVDELTALSFTATATDADLPANTLTFSLIGAPAGATITAGGAFSWTPTEAQGPNDYTFKVRVTDNGTGALYDEEEITVHVDEVNQPPVLAAIGDQTVDEGDDAELHGQATDADIPANTLTYSLSGSLPGRGHDRRHHRRVHLDAHRGAGARRLHRSTVTSAHGGADRRARRSR